MLKRAYTVSVFTVGFLLPTILILIIYTKIFPTASSLVRRTPGLDAAEAVACKVREERKVALTVSILTGFFLMAWSPFFFLSMLAEFCAGCLPKGDGMTALVVFVKWMPRHYSNGVVNPLVFVIKHSEMQKRVFKLFGISIRRGRKKNVQQNGWRDTVIDWTRPSQSKINDFRLKILDGDTRYRNCGFWLRHNKTHLILPKAR